MLSRDRALRALERENPMEYHRMLTRLGMVHDYGCELGPVLPIQAVCAEPDCGQQLDNGCCSYCEEHEMGEWFDVRSWRGEYNAERDEVIDEIEPFLFSTWAIDSSRYTAINEQFGIVPHELSRDVWHRWVQKHNELINIWQGPVINRIVKLEDYMFCLCCHDEAALRAQYCNTESAQ